jgi:hypothetical protein
MEARIVNLRNESNQIRNEKNIEQPADVDWGFE